MSRDVIFWLTLDFNSFMDQEMVAVYVKYIEERPRQFNIHKDLLCKQSMQLHALIESGEEKKAITLHDVSYESFESFSKWLYSESLAVEEMEETETDDSEDTDSSSENGEEGDDKADDTYDKDGNEATSANGNHKEYTSSSRIDMQGNSWYAGVNCNSRVLARLLDLYIFADRYKAVSFKRAVMLSFQRLMAAKEMSPCSTIVKHALDNLDFSSPLCKYLCQCYGHYADFRTADQDRLATLSPGFFSTVLLITFERLDEDDDVDDGDDDWCDYHEHKSDQARTKCREARRSDADVSRERLKAQRLHMAQLLRRRRR